MALCGTCLSDDVNTTPDENGNCGECSADDWLEDRLGL